MIIRIFGIKTLLTITECRYPGKHSEVWRYRFYERKIQYYKKCLRNINAYMPHKCKIQKGCIQWIIPSLVATAASSLVMFINYWVDNAEMKTSSLNYRGRHCYLKSNRDYLCKVNQCSKFGNHSNKGS